MGLITLMDRTGLRNVAELVADINNCDLVHSRVLSQALVFVIHLDMRNELSSMNKSYLRNGWHS